MSEISRLAVLLAQCVRIQRLSEEREEALHPAHIANPGDPTVNRQIQLNDQVHDDASFLRGGFEVELCAHIPETVPEVLLQILVINDVVRSHELTGAAEKTVRMLLQNVIQGLVNLSPGDAVVRELLPTYFHPQWDAWQHKFEEFKKDCEAAA